MGSATDQRSRSSALGPRTGSATKHLLLSCATSPHEPAYPPQETTFSGFTGWTAFWHSPWWALWQLPRLRMRICSLQPVATPSAQTSVLQWVAHNPLDIPLSAVAAAAGAKKAHAGRSGSA